MMNRSHHHEALRESATVEVGVFFPDFDDTVLDGTAMQMTDEELLEATLNSGLLHQIETSRAAGIPVVMVTRNDAAMLERIFRIRPEWRPLFDEVIPCPVQEKSRKILEWLAEHDMDPARAIFADDRDSERRDVDDNVDGCLVFSPAEIAQRTIRRATSTRRRARRVFANSEPLQPDQIPLAA